MVILLIKKAGFGKPAIKVLKTPENAFQAVKRIPGVIIN
jgi:hypothetical protein